MHGTHVELSISACIDKKIQVTTTIDGNTALQEEVKSNPKNSPAVKKSVRPQRKAIVKKDVKSKVAAVMVG